MKTISMCPLCFYVPLVPERHQTCPICQTKLEEIPGTPARLTARWDYPDDYICPCGCNGKPKKEQTHVISLETFRCNGATFTAGVHGQQASISHHLKHSSHQYGLVSLTIDHIGEKPR